MFRIVVVVAAVGGGLILSGASAQACSDCLPAAQQKAKPTAQRSAKPTRKPVATAAARVVKTASGNYARVPLPRPAKRQTAKVQYLPVVVAPEAAQAFAMTQAFATQPIANVRMVTAEEVNEIDLAASDAPITPILVPTRVGSAVAVVNAREFNAIDQQAAAPQAASRETAACAGASASAPLQVSWLDRARKMIDFAYELVAARAP